MEGEELAEDELENVLEARLDIGAVRVVGAERTRHRFLEWVLSAGRQKDTFGSILEQLTETIEALRQTDCFNSVEAYLDESDDSGKADVTMTVDEKPRVSLTVGTQSGGSIEDTTLGGVWILRNVFGRLERLRVTVGGSPTSIPQIRSNSSIGSRNYTEIDFTKPFVYGLDSRLGLRLYNSEEIYSYSVKRTGGDIIFTMPLLAVSYESSWRQVGETPAQAGSKIRNECGHSFKSAIKLVSEIDLRDNPVSPNIGLFGQGKIELAGLSGDVRHFSHEFQTQLHWPLGDSGVTLHSSAQFGAIHNLDRSTGLRMIDRFMIGGPGSLRGFRRRGVGDHDGKDPLGSDYYCSMFLGFSIPIGYRGILQSFDTKAQVFANVADAGSMSSVAQRIVRPGTWLENTRASVGIGVAAALPIGRLEINLCHVLRSVTGDREKNGLQIGLTQSFS